MSQDYYRVLGVQSDATQEAIRAAYRKLVKQVHPDHSKSGSSERFIQVQEAYEVLSDESRRREYDRILRMRAERAAPAQSTKPKPEARPTTSGAKSRPAAQARQQAPREPAVSVAADMAKLGSLFNRGKFAEAESLAKKILQRDGKLAMPYAVLGDVARQRNEIDRALTLYAYATQLDPRNRVYLRKYQELLARQEFSSQPKSREEVETIQAKSLFAALGISILLGALVVLLKDRPVFPQMQWISTWNLSLFTMLFASGITMGACLSLSLVIDRLDSISSNSLGRISPLIGLIPIAVVCFWLAVGLYFVVGYFQKMYVSSITRVFGGVTAVLTVAIFAAMISGRFDLIQVLLWGGNVAFVGAICGWMVTDSLKVA